jgi:lactose/raffinose/galactose permease
LSGAISNGVVGWTVASVGMVGTVVSVPAGSIFVFKLIMVGIPLVLVILALVIFLKKFKITEDFHEQILQKLHD